MIVLLDTNFLMLQGRNKLDILKEIDRVLDFNYKIKILQCVVEELEKVAKGKGKDSVAAKIGLEIIKKNGIQVLKIHGKADQEIVKYAKRHETVVCTEDRALKHKLLKLHIPVIYLRGRKTLSLLGYF